MKRLFIIMMLFAPMAVMAQKFGHVDSQSIMTTLPEIAKINGELQATAQQFENELKAMQDEFQRKMDEFEKAKATMNATAQPNSSMVMLCVVAHEASSFRRSSKSSSVAPAIVGTARKNENSAERFLVRPCVLPPTIVAIERDTPGITEIHWYRPMLKAFFSFRTVSSEPLLKSLSQ